MDDPATIILTTQTRPGTADTSFVVAPASERELRAPAKLIVVCDSLLSAVTTFFVAVSKSSKDAMVTSY